MFDDKRSDPAPDATSGDTTTRISRELIEQIYDELRALARSQRRRHGAHETINTTALVHETYAKMSEATRRGSLTSFVNRGHFFRVAAGIMRDVVVDYAKAQSAQKRGGRTQPTSLQDMPHGVVASPELDLSEVLTVNDALSDLADINREAAEVVELRYFAGLTAEEAAEALGLSSATVNRRWAVARAWLYQRLSER